MRYGALDAGALWPAVGDHEAIFGGLLGPEAMVKGIAAAPDETITTTLPLGVDLGLNDAFFDGIETFDPMPEIKAYVGPLFVTKVILDRTVLPEVSDACIAAHGGPEELWTADMDHVFNVFMATDSIDKMNGATVDFFNAHRS